MKTVEHVHVFVNLWSICTKFCSCYGYGKFSCVTSLHGTQNVSI